MSRESSDGHVSEPEKNTPIYWTNAQQYMTCLDFHHNVQNPTPFLSSICGNETHLFNVEHTLKSYFLWKISSRLQPDCSLLQA